MLIKDSYGARREIRRYCSTSTWETNGKTWKRYSGIGFIGWPRVYCVYNHASKIENSRQPYHSHHAWNQDRRQTSRNPEQGNKWITLSAERGFLYRVGRLAGAVAAAWAERAHNAFSGISSLCVAKGAAREPFARWAVWLECLVTDRNVTARLENDRRARRVDSKTEWKTI